MRPVGFEPTPTWVKARDAAVTPRPHNWSGVSVSIDVRQASSNSFVSWFTSGSPENRTQRNAVISRVWATSPRLPLKSGTSESNRDPPAPKAGVLPSAPLPVCLQSERPDLNRRSPGPRPGAIPGFATFCRQPRALRSQWVGRCSNPRLLVFSQVLNRLSYQPNKKSPASSVTPGFSWGQSQKT